jgi:hypothetical protein
MTRLDDGPVGGGRVIYIATASISHYDGPFLSPCDRASRPWPGDVPVYPPTPIPFCWGPHGSLMLLAMMLAAYAVLVAAALLVL